MKNIFVSSTFHDYHAERDALRNRVAPKLNDAARACGERVEFCDLRWGIDTSDLKEEAQSARKVLDICLDEIDRTRPLILVLLGDRYGYRPGEELIRSTMKKKGFVPADLEENAFDMSVTQLEIEYGALYHRPGSAEPDVFIYYRSIERENPSGTNGDDSEEARADRERMEKLKARVKRFAKERRANYHEFDYSVKWEDGKPDAEGLDRFVSRVTEDLLSYYREEWEQLRDIHPFARDELIQWRYLEEKSRFFRARKELAGLVQQTLTDDGTEAVCLRGEVGSGKSTLFSSVCQRMRETGYAVVAFMGGVTNLSTSMERIQASLLWQLEELAQMEHTGDGTDVAAVSDTDEETGAGAKRKKRQARMDTICGVLAEKGTRLLIGIDALDQVAGTELVEALRFLPGFRHPQIRLFITGLPEVFSGMTDAEGEHRVLDIPSLDDTDREAVMEAVLGRNKRQLARELKQMLIRKQDAEKPLYLELAVSCLLLIDTSDCVGEDDIILRQKGAIAEMPEKQEPLARHLLQMVVDVMPDPACMERVLKYMALFRRGISERDLEGIFALETGNPAYRLPTAECSIMINHLPDAFLRRHDGRYDFFHQSMRRGILSDTTEDEIRRMYETAFGYLRGLAEDNPVRMQEIMWSALCLEPEKNPVVQDFLVDYIHDLMRPVMADYLMYRETPARRDGMRLARSLSAADIYECLPEPSVLRGLVETLLARAAFRKQAAETILDKETFREETGEAEALCVFFLRDVASKLLHVEAEKKRLEEVVCAMLPYQETVSGRIRTLIRRRGADAGILQADSDEVSWEGLRMLAADAAWLEQILVYKGDTDKEIALYQDAMENYLLTEKMCYGHLSGGNYADRIAHRLKAMREWRTYRSDSTRAKADLADAYLQSSLPSSATTAIKQSQIEETIRALGLLRDLLDQEPEDHPYDEAFVRRIRRGILESTRKLSVLYAWPGALQDWQKSLVYAEEGLSEEKKLPDTKGRAALLKQKGSALLHTETDKTRAEETLRSCVSVYETLQNEQSSDTDELTDCRELLADALRRSGEKARVQESAGIYSACREYHKGCMGQNPKKHWTRRVILGIKTALTHTTLWEMSRSAAGQEEMKHFHAACEGFTEVMKEIMEAKVPYGEMSGYWGLTVETLKVIRNDFLSGRLKGFGEDGAEQIIPWLRKCGAVFAEYAEESNTFQQVWGLLYRSWGILWQDVQGFVSDRKTDAVWEKDGEPLTFTKSMLVSDPDGKSILGQKPEEAPEEAPEYGLSLWEAFGDPDEYDEEEDPESEPAENQPERLPDPGSWQNLSLPERLSGLCDYGETAGALWKEWMASGEPEDLNRAERIRTGFETAMTELLETVEQEFSMIGLFMGLKTEIDKREYDTWGDCLLEMTEWKEESFFLSISFDGLWRFYELLKELQEIREAFQLTDSALLCKTLAQTGLAIGAAGTCDAEILSFDERGGYRENAVEPCLKESVEYAQRLAEQAGSEEGVGLLCQCLACLIYACLHTKNPDMAEIVSYEDRMEAIDKKRKANRGETAGKQEREEKPYNAIKRVLGEKYTTEQETLERLSGALSLKKKSEADQDGTAALLPGERRHFSDIGYIRKRLQEERIQSVKKQGAGHRQADDDQTLSADSERAQDGCSEELCRELVKLADIHREAGDEQEALHCIGQALDAFQETKWDYGQAQTGMTLLHEMAYVCGASGDRQKAVTLYEEAYAFSRQFRNDSDETRDDNRNCESLWKAAEACEQLGYAREALRFYRQCYEEDKGGFLEADRFGGLEKLKHLAAALERLGAVDEALERYRQLYEDGRRIHGEDSYFASDCLKELASAHERAGHEQEAIALFQQGCDWYERHLGKNHDNTWRFLVCLASACETFGKKEKALALYRQMYENDTRCRGIYERRTKESLHNLCDACERMGLAQESVDLYRQMYEAKKRDNGIADSSGRDSLEELLKACERLGFEQEAFRIRQDALEAHRREYERGKQQLARDDSIFPKGAMYVRRKLVFLISAYEQYGGDPDELALYRQELEAIKDCMEDHGLRSATEIADDAARAGDHQKAYEGYNALYLSCKRKLGAEHTLTKRLLCKQLLEAAALCTPEEATGFLEQACEIRKGLLGEEHVQTRRIQEQLALTYGLEEAYPFKTEIELISMAHTGFMSGKYDEAIRLYEAAYKKSRRIMGEDHVNTRTALKGLIISYEGIGDSAKADEWRKRRKRLT